MNKRNWVKMSSELNLLSTQLHSKSIDWFLYEGNTDT